MKNRNGWRNRVLDEIARIGRNRGNKAGAGPNGFCVCPNCGNEETHQVGIPCYRRICSKCGTKMRRK
jgi:uncharacterized protein